MLKNHYGNLGGGHYTAFVRDREDHWLSFDDAKVSEIPEESVRSAPSAYVLFYALRRHKEVGKEMVRKDETDLTVDPEKSSVGSQCIIN